MKPTSKILCLLILISLLSAGCSVMGQVQGRQVKPSDTIIFETRPVSGFTGVEMGTFGKVVLSQGDKESLGITGPDNLVKLIETEVRNGILYIEAKEEFTVTSLDEEHALTFSIMAQEIDSLTISGLGSLEMESLATPRLSITVSGGGDARIGQLSTDDLRVVLSGVGNVTLAGDATQADIELSGTGDMSLADLKIQSAQVSLSGLGSATLWVTEQLSGEISGVGGVSYYGSPATEVKTSGVGEFKALGSK